VIFDFMDSDKPLNTRQLSEKEGAGEKSKGEFVIGLVTFIVFIVFMSLWMYFSPE